MQEFHGEMYETLPEHYPDLAFVRAKDHNDNPVLVIPPNGVAPFWLSSSTLSTWCRFLDGVPSTKDCFLLESTSVWLSFIAVSTYKVLSESKQSVKRKWSTSPKFHPARILHQWYWSTRNIKILIFIQHPFLITRFLKLANSAIVWCVGSLI